MRTINIKGALSAPNSPQTKRGANGKFRPKPLLFHLRHPNSKTNQSKFWQILSPKNCFAKTSSALVPPPARSIEGGTPKKNVLSFLEEKIGCAQIRKARNIFLWCPPYSAGGGADSFVQFPLEIGSSKVYNYSTKMELNGFFKAKWRDALRASRHFCFFKTFEFHFGVSIVPSSHLFPKPMTPHALSAWWL